MRVEEVVPSSLRVFDASLQGASVATIAVSPCLVTAEKLWNERSGKRGKAVFTAGSVILDVRGGRLESRLVRSPIGRPSGAIFSFRGDRGDEGLVSDVQF